MISNKDRSGWFGASDTYKIMGNWNTKTFYQFWLEKLGVIHSKLSTPAMTAGSFYEHRILEFIGVTNMDRQIKKRRLRLRVNLDGEDENTNYEVKTYSSETFKIIKPYWQQCQVETFSDNKPTVIVAYRMTPDDYRNFFNPIDPMRLSFHPIKYDKEFISLYLPRLEYLANCLKKKVNP